MEDEAIWQTLAELGCDFAQGHYLSKPLPAAELVGWFQQLPETLAPSGTADDDHAAVAAVAD